MPTATLSHPSAWKAPARFPDKPIMAGPAIFSSLVDGQWICQPKWDGWRCMTTVNDDGLMFATRHMKPCPVSPALSETLAPVLAKLPAGTILDGEWMARRAGNAQGEEHMVFFDLMRLGMNWVVDRPTINRFDILCDLVPPELLVEHSLSGYAAMFERSKRDPRVEGIVLKHVSSKFKGSTRSCYVNPLFLKIKYRDGCDGEKLVA